MKVLVCGSRTVTDISIVSAALYYTPIDYDLIIHGGAIGVDQLAEKVAVNSKIPTKIFKPDWNKHGKKAGILRNIEMVDECDAVLAIWDGKSKGTKFTIDYAQKQGKKVYVKEVNL